MNTLEEINKILDATDNRPADFDSVATLGHRLTEYECWRIAIPRLVEALRYLMAIFNDDLAWNEHGDVHDRILSLLEGKTE